MFADITNVNLGCVRGDTRQGETLEVMGQKKYTWKTVKQFSDGGGGGKVMSHQVNKIMLKQ